MTSNNYLQVVDRNGKPISLDDWNECAKPGHGKKHMVHLENLNSEVVMPDGTKIVLRKGTWVCRACTGEEYFKELEGMEHEGS
jgi:hypothetical protein